MSLTKKERFKYKLVSFSKKNFICKVLAAPLRFIILLGDVLGSNGKKIALSVSFLVLFPVFSSFSFGVSQEEEIADLVIDFGVLDENITVVEKASEISLPVDSTEFNEIIVTESGEVTEDDLYLSDELIDDLYTSYNPEDVIKPGDKDNNSSKFDKDQWSLILINKSHFIPEDYDLQLGTISGWYQVDKRMLPDLSLMLKDAKDAGIPLSIASPYRSSATQVMLFNAKITKFMGTGMSYLEAYKLAGQAVTIPGASEHEAGLCLDILGSGYRGLDFGFANTPAGKWLANNAHKYGFILRYPENKEYQTTIEYEPWHFRYVGIEAATVIYEEDLCLEEFWEIYLDE